MNPVARSALARVASFVPTAVATLLTSRLIIDHYGVPTFDSFALMFSVINLIPLGNLGVGAALTSAFAAEGGDPSHKKRTLLTSLRVTTASTLITIAIAMAFSYFHVWTTLLGRASGSNFWVGVAVVIYSLSIIPGLGQNILLGLNRNHVTILIQTFFNPLIATLAAAAILINISGDITVIVPCVAMFIVQLVTGVLAARAGHFGWFTIARRMFNRARYPGASIRAMSGPVLLVTLATPIALQSDRIVLSQVSTKQAVAEYSIALQVFSPALVLIAASAQPLWPMYTAARSRGERGPSISRIMGMFLGASLLGGAVLALLANPIATITAASQVHVSPLLAFSGGLAVVTAALSYPAAMSLMDPVGIRLVVWCTGIALPLNIGLSILLAHELGAAGPLLGSCIIGILVQAVPAFIYSRDRQTAGRHRRSRRPQQEFVDAAAAPMISAEVAID
jgi:O-antigen/teichoic acid export membrane protein